MTETMKNYGKQTSCCHRPDDGSLKLNPVVRLRIEGVRVGCDCTIDKSEIYF
jgi:hypothetical protein